MSAKNIFKKKKKKKKKNFIILVTKQIIYRATCKNEMVEWNQIEKELFSLYDLELFNALNAKLNKHVTKWKYIKPECMYLISNTYCQK